METAVASTFLYAACVLSGSVRAHDLRWNLQWFEAVVRGFTGCRIKMKVMERAIQPPILEVATAQVRPFVGAEAPDRPADSAFRHTAPGSVHHLNRSIGLRARVGGPKLGNGLRRSQLLQLLVTGGPRLGQRLPQGHGLLVRHDRLGDTKPVGQDHPRQIR